MPDPSLEFLTVKEYAERYRVSVFTVYTAIRFDRLQHKVERVASRTIRIAVPLGEAAAALPSTQGERRVYAKCYGCGGPTDRPHQPHCRACHAAYQRAHRPKHRELTPEQRGKANCRSYSRVLEERGHLVRTPCPCGSTEVERHHPDYGNPREVLYRCKSCHREIHAAESTESTTTNKTV